MIIRSVLKPCATHLTRAPTQWQSYATITSPPNPAHDPTIWPISPYPTPYQILGMSPAAPNYSKSRFSELVKLYHPDKRANVDPRCEHVAEDVRLERYHMVVTSHDILSSPEKRAMYDRFGTGWSQYRIPLPPRSPRPPSSTVVPSNFDPFGQYPRDYDPYGARMNATWEDWQRWHEAREGGGDGKRAEPRFMPHSLFAMAVFLATVTAGVAQHQSATSISMQRGLLREEEHRNALREYELLKKRTTGVSRVQRIESFASQRGDS